MLMENGIWGAPDAFVKREGSERVWGHLAAQDAGEAHINIVLAAFVPAGYLAVAPLSHWPDVLSAARHPGLSERVRQSCQSSQLSRAPARTRDARVKKKNTEKSCKLV